MNYLEAINFGNKQLKSKNITFCENIKDLLIEIIPEAKLENLEIGDYIFKLDDKPFLIIERKTVNDYAASILDHRSREQKNV